MKRLLILLASLLVVGSVYGETLRFWGGTYIGDVRLDRPHGQGTWSNFVGDKYVGKWKDDKMHGQGSETWASADNAVNVEPTMANPLAMLMASSAALLESKFLFPGLGAANWLRLTWPHLQRSSGINKAGLA